MYLIGVARALKMQQCPLSRATGDNGHHQPFWSQEQTYSANNSAKKELQSSGELVSYCMKHTLDVYEHSIVSAHSQPHQCFLPRVHAQRVK